MSIHVYVLAVRSACYTDYKMRFHFRTIFVRGLGIFLANSSGSTTVRYK